MFGVSSYPNVWDQYDSSSKTLDVVQSIRNMDTELTTFAGTSVGELRAKGKVFILNELGLGGCREFDCNGMYSDSKFGPDIYGLSQAAYNGAGAFQKTWEPEPNVYDVFNFQWTKAFRMEWYRQQLQFFADLKNPYAPDNAYIWVAGSWDIAGIYHTSYLGQDTSLGCNPMKAFCDPDLMAMIQAYNKQGTVPKKTLFTLPGPSYYQKPARRAAVTAAGISQMQAAAKLQCIRAPLRYKPSVCSRPTWN